MKISNTETKNGSCESTNIDIIIPKEEAPNEEAPKEETPKEEAPNEEAPKEETPKEDAPKEDAPKEDAPKEDAPKEDASKEDAPKEDAPNEEAPKDEAPNEEAPKDETPKDEASKEEAPKDETPKDEASKEEAPKDETPKDETIINDESSEENKAENIASVHSASSRPMIWLNEIKSKLKSLSDAKDEHDDSSNNSVVAKTSQIIGVCLCVIFGIMLLFNLTIIIKGSINPDTPPRVLGVAPLVVLSGSMSGDAPDHIEVGDLIFVGKVQPEKLEVGDIIAFMQGKTVITHRIVSITSDDNGELLFETKGDANNASDTQLVPSENIVGIYKGRIPKIGDMIIFLQTPTGMILCIGLPLLAFIVYDVMRRRLSESKESLKTAELEAELERLRKLAGEIEEDK